MNYLGSLGNDHTSILFKCFPMLIKLINLIVAMLAWSAIPDKLSFQMQHCSLQSINTHVSWTQDWQKKSSSNNLETFNSVFFLLCATTRNEAYLLGLLATRLCKSPVVRAWFRMKDGKVVQTLFVSVSEIAEWVVTRHLINLTPPISCPLRL